MNKISASVLALAMIVFISGCNSTPSISDKNSLQAVSAETNFEISSETGNADSSVAGISSDAKESGTIVPEDSAYQLIGAYADDEDCFRFDMTNWQASENYDLFREYFFGIWDAADSFMKTNIIIDDSEASFEMTQHIFHFLEFYQISENVLAFTMSGNAQGLIFWLKTDEPDKMYVNEFAWPGIFFKYVSEPDFLTKIGASQNEPSNGFLSIFKLREMSQNYGIDFDLLTYIDYGIVDGKYLLHSATYDFYPMYLVSEANDKIVIKTSVGNLMYNKLTPIDIICTFEKTNGEWSRNVELV